MVEIILESTDEIGVQGIEVFTERVVFVNTTDSSNKSSTGKASNAVGETEITSDTEQSSNTDAGSAEGPDIDSGNTSATEKTGLRT